MAKKTRAAAPAAAPATAAENPLSSYNFEQPTGDGGTTRVSFENQTQVLLNGVYGIDGVIASFAEEMGPRDTLLAHAFYRALGETSKVGLEGIRPRQIALAKTGKIVTDLGTLAVTSVAASTESVFMPEIVELLESKGVLPQAVEMLAVMKDGISVEDIDESDMTVLQKYFKIDLVPSAAKVAALVSLGKLKAEDVAKVTTQNQTRAGYDRLTVKLTDDISEAFGLTTSE